jgi:hypothetical protein
MPVTPASRYEDIYDFETQIEAAVKSALESEGLTAHKQRDTDSLTTPRVEIQYVTGAAMEEYALLPDGTRRPSHFIGTLGTTIVTARQTNGSVHALWRARVRSTLYDFRNTINTTTLLPYLEVWHLQESGTSPSIQEESFDISSVSWALRFSIRHNAWPQ